MPLSTASSVYRSSTYPSSTDGSPDGASNPPGQPPPFFIVGADRSGTTLLRLYLNAHSRLAIPSESWFLPELLRAFEPSAVLAGPEAAMASELVTRHPRFKDGWHVQSAALEQRLANTAPLTLARYIDALYRLETGIADDSTWGDKTPEYVEHVLELDRCFPLARFINVVRDGRDVYLSLVKRRWSDRGYTPRELGRYWSRCVRAAEGAAATVGGERFLSVAYEDLVLATRVTLERVCAFLGVGFEERMLSAHDEAGQIITASESQAGVHEKLFRAPRPSDVGRWREVRGDRRLGMAAGVMAAELRAAGYLDAPGPLTGAAARAAALCDHLWRRRLRPGFRRALRRLKRRAHPAA